MADAPWLAGAPVQSTLPPGKSLFPGHYET